MTEERFEEFLKNALDEMDPVPTPPREAMWAQIDQARRFSRKAIVRRLLKTQGFRRLSDGARYRVRTCDPYRVKVVLYH